MLHSFLLVKFIYKMIMFKNRIDILSPYIWGQEKKNHLQINMTIYVRQFWSHICNITLHILFMLP